MLDGDNNNMSTLARVEMRYYGSFARANGSRPFSISCGVWAGVWGNLDCTSLVMA